MRIVLREDQQHAVHWAEDVLTREGGVLFADEPGFGKSYQALALAQRLGDQVVILAPRALHPMWQDYLSRFGLDGKLYSHGDLRSDKRLSALLHEPPPAVIVVDEAHAFVNPRTQGYRALASYSFGIPLILLTATPFQNRPEDALHLLALFSGEAAWLCTYPEARQSQLQPLMQRLSRARLQKQKRDASREFFHVDADTALIQRAAAAIAVHDEPEALIFHSLLSRRLSSFSAWSQSLRHAQCYLDELAEALAEGRTLPRSQFWRDFRDGQRAFSFLLDALPAPQLSLDLVNASRHVLCICAAQSRATKPLEAWHWLLELPKPVVVFSQYRATVNEIYRKLWAHTRLIRWTGAGISSNFPRHGRDAASSLPHAILVATDVAAEGIDLSACRTLVHADLHWNPMRTLQREGRILRGEGQDRARIYAPTYSEALTRAWPLEARRLWKSALFARYGANEARVSACHRGSSLRPISNMSSSGYLQALLRHLRFVGRGAPTDSAQTTGSAQTTDIAQTLRAWLQPLAQARLLPVGAEYWLESLRCHSAGETQNGRAHGVYVQAETRARRIYHQIQAQLAEPTREPSSLAETCTVSRGTFDSEF